MQLNTLQLQALRTCNRSSSNRLVQRRSIILYI